MQKLPEDDLPELKGENVNEIHAAGECMQMINNKYINCSQMLPDV